MTATINNRKHYNLYLTNDWTGTPHRPVYRTEGGKIDGTPVRGNINKLFSEIAELRRVSGGCYVAYAITDDDGNEITSDVEQFRMMQSCN